jgi:hypothetical protein
MDCPRPGAAAGGRLGQGTSRAIEGRRRDVGRDPTRDSPAGAMLTPVLRPGVPPVGPARCDRALGSLTEAGAE